MGVIPELTVGLSRRNGVGFVAILGLLVWWGAYVVTPCSEAEGTEQQRHQMHDKVTPKQ